MGIRPADSRSCEAPHRGPTYHWMRQKSPSHTAYGGWFVCCANGDALSGAGAIVKRAEEGDGAERRSGAATSEMRNAWGDVPGAMAARGEERR